MTRNKYINGIDSLRFIAFMMVFLSHCFYTKKSHVVLNEYFTKLTFVKNYGFLGVNVFFVISGFLISYLLFQEISSNSSFNLKSFYLRRILRIWPLYFFILLLSIFLEPYIGTQVDYKPYFFFYSNFSIAYFQNSGSIVDHLWSISVEEHFYFLFPLFLWVGVKLKKPAVIFFLIIILAAIFKLSHIHNPEISYYHTFSCFFDFFVGSLAGFFVVEKKDEIFSFVKNTNVIYFISVTLFFTLFTSDIHSLKFEILNLFFTISVSILLMSLALSPNSKPNKIISYLGKLSFGMYCYHIALLRITELMFYKIGIQMDLTSVVFLIPFTSLMLCILFSSISYHWLEKPIFKLRTRFLQ